LDRFGSISVTPYAGDKDEDEYTDVEYLYDDEADGKDNKDLNQPDNPAAGKPLSAAPVANLARICWRRRLVVRQRANVRFNQKQTGRV
jgi:hypothetical protein